MKVILSESRFDSIFSEWLEKEGFELKIGWYGVGRLNGYDERIITGYVKIVKDGEPIGLSGGYQFSYKYEDGELSLYDIQPYVGFVGFGGLFKIFPTELVTEYFSEQVKDYIYMKLESK